MPHRSHPRRFFIVPTIILGAASLFPVVISRAQAPAAPAAASANTSQRGTIKAIAGSTVTLTTDAGKEIAVTVAPTAKILQIAPGSTDLKTATPIQLTEIAVGDRVLITGKPAADSPDSLNAIRVVLMKSTDIADRKAAQQADWQRRGSGGIVSAVDPAGKIIVTNGSRKTEVDTTAATLFRRYAGDSIKFEDAQTGTLAQIQPGDQVRVRGARSEDGSSIAAEEIVSGSFLNLAGTVAAVNAAAGTVTLKDLATKKNYTVKITANSDFRVLPPEAAARFAARARGAQPGAPGATPAAGANPGSNPTRTTEGARADGMQTNAPRPGSGYPGAGTPGEGRAPAAGSPGGYPGGPGGPGGMGAGRSAGADLSQMITRLPQGNLAALKPGEAVMIVASQSQPGASSVTAVTMLSGVEPILAAAPGAPTLTISPWNVGGGAPEGAGGGQ